MWPQQARAKAKAIGAAAARAQRAGLLRATLAALFAQWRATLRAWLAADVAERRLFLWSPAAMGVGVILYFAAADEPSLAAPAIGLAVFAVGAFLAQERPVGFPVLVAVAAMFAGFLTASLRTATVAAPHVERLLTAEVSGFVEQMDYRPDGARFLLRVTVVEGLAAPATPYRVRLTARSRPTAVAGDFVKVRARLLPPPEPPRPGAYDFGRDAFFKRIGAVGSAPGAVAPAATELKAPADLQFFAWIDRKRNDLTERIARAIGGQAGALAAALVTGKRDLLTEQTNEALRAAGVYHIVSVSGLHMVLAAGAFFWTARAILALFAGLALRWPVKKIAATLAMLGATAYCLFTGSEVATERSLIMILVMLGAVVFDRPALSMRNLAIAAIIVLIREPETLMGPSFQMSFAAVAGLVAFAEWQRDRTPFAPGERGGVFARFADAAWLWIMILFATTLIATLATAPYAAFHFQRLNPLGLIGNMLALPFVSFIVMPAAVAGVLLWPFGLDGVVWTLMGWGTAPVIHVAQAVAGLGGSVATLRAFGAAALLVSTLGLLWFVLWRTHLRWFALAPAAVGAFLMTRGEPVDLFVARSGQGAAYRGNDGRLVVLGDASRFDAQFWLQADADARRPDEPSVKTGTTCDRLGCAGTDRMGRAIVWVRDARAFPEDCRRAAIIVTPLEAPGWCSDPLIADRRTFDDYGALAVRFAGAEPVVEGTRSPAQRRPWQASLRQSTLPAAIAPPVETPAQIDQRARPSRRFDQPRAPPAPSDIPLRPEEGDPDQ